MTRERPIMKIIVLIMETIPKNLVSFTTGAVTRVKIPSVLGRLVNRLFVFLFRINMKEAEKDITEYDTIEDVFTRKLKPGSRRLEGEVISPADGYLAKSEKVIEGYAIQAKSHEYSVEDFVFGDLEEPDNMDFKPAWYTTIYLAPHNYHRVHSPVSGKLLSIRHIPGELWPVNRPFVGWVPKMFTRNERLVFEIEWENNSRVYVVMVGALNVGRMTTPFQPDLITNTFASLSNPESKHFTLPNGGISILAGDELGTFMLGSTVVIIFPEEFTKKYQIVQSADNQPIIMGQSILRK